jgi:hypothetical protein
MVRCIRLGCATCFRDCYAVARALDPSGGPRRLWLRAVASMEAGILQGMRIRPFGHYSILKV